MGSTVFRRIRYSRQMDRRCCFWWAALSTGGQMFLSTGGQRYLQVDRCFCLQVGSAIYRWTDVSVYRWAALSTGEQMFLSTGGQHYLQVDRCFCLQVGSIIYKRAGTVFKRADVVVHKRAGVTSTGEQVMKSASVQVLPYPPAGWRKRRRTAPGRSTSGGGCGPAAGSPRPAPTCSPTPP